METLPNSEFRYRDLEKHYTRTTTGVYVVQTGVKPWGDAVFFTGMGLTTALWLRESGILSIPDNYWWDGASGPGVPDKYAIRASLVHDALYQLIREGVLPMAYRKAADKELRKIMREDGAPWWYARLFYMAVRKFGGSHAVKGVE